jgi:L-alanine-DL-glutamate epimerase-like enolase superfamily enzyme
MSSSAPSCTPAIQVDQDGLARPPRGPGLGIDVDKDAIERYAV